MDTLGPQVHPESSSGADVLDDIDNQLVDGLVANGRASYAELGRSVGLSAHAVGERVRRLQREGAIAGFTAILDLAQMGRALDAIIDVRLVATTAPEAFEAHARKLPAVQEIVFVTGRFDYQLRVVCTDADQLDQTVRTLRQRAGAALTETRIVLRAESPRHTAS